MFDHTAYMRQWRKDHPQRAKDIARDSRLKHKDARRQTDYDKHRESPIKLMFNNAKMRAKNCGVPFTITKDDIVVPTLCPILHIALIVGGGRSAPSLDRIVPALGYVPGNVQVISHLANTMKSDATLVEMIRLGEWAKERTQ